LVQSLFFIENKDSDAANMQILLFGFLRIGCWIKALLALRNHMEVHFWKSRDIRDDEKDEEIEEGKGEVDRVWESQRPEI